ncbi:hypothetical protein AB4298_20560 [Shewanella sp. 10N.261.52.F9]|uniref:hypothetical protein n=1 Tax=Shewanella sp. 10N.261.52.F9 TaxID=3229684 RepID=UPI0035546BCD
MNINFYKVKALLVSVVLLTGCATKLNYLVGWDKKWKQCDADAKKSSVQFPSSKWFESLKIEEQKAVFIYLHNLKQYECTELETVSLKKVLDEAEIATLESILQGFIYFQPPSNEFVKSLDKVELEKLSKEVVMFDLIKVAEELIFKGG